MKKYIFFIALLGLFLVTKAQIIYSDTSTKWYHIDHASLQYAGGIGWIAGGMGFDFVNDKIAIDFLAGYLPTGIGGVRVFTLNLKSNYKPWHFRVNENLSIVPINIGFISSHAIGEQYNKNKKGIYPEGYYWWPANNRIGPSIGQNYFFTITSGKRRVVEIYWDLSCDDFGLYTYFDNKTVKLHHIFNFDLGFKWYF
ncbi:MULTISPECIES: hypothetical protein [unclassified Lentimicrobium]|uniref:hypothetical protein n=1 Tax=unclassified Lentimicrobium TaxID=2677434 RepID=UPI001552C0F9|nr:MULTISPECIES: hypothetical protein [unclassified Lentimicrobium]NPD44842.1 hypothetical protein [Lentimicrobium sp. S6]NPD83141.1 hypothetical protein [Lentimicrobium sp. L6]